MTDWLPVIERFREPKQDREGHFMAFCPAHPDGKTHGRRSLSITIAQDRLLVDCFNGCSTEDVLEAAGLEMSDLFAGERQTQPPAKPEPELTLDGFCRRRRLDKSRLVMRWRVKEVTQFNRPALEYPTGVSEPGGERVLRYKFLDHTSERDGRKVWWKGGRAHWYGLGAAKAHGGVLYVVNGEPSVWACDQHGVAAVCLCAGEGTVPTKEMVAELAGSRFTEVRIVYDLDEAGVKGASKVRQALEAGGVRATVRKLPAYLGNAGDVGDLQMWHAGGFAEVLASLPEVDSAPPPVEVRRDGDDFTFTFWAHLVQIEASHIKETREDVYARIRAYAITPQGERIKQVISTTKINLLAPTGKTSLIKRLRERLRDVDWDELVEQIAETIVQEYGALNPVQEVTDFDSAPPEIKMLLAPVIPYQQPVVLYGPGGSLKSYVGLTLAVCGSLLLPFGPVQPTEPLEDSGVVLYLDWETDFDRFRQRLRGVCGALGVSHPPRKLKYVKMRGSLASNSATLRHLVSQINAEVVIVDSISRACMELETSTAVNEFFDVLDGFQAFGRPVTRIVLSHVSKESVGQKHAKPFGSIHVENAARCTWELRAVKNDLGNYSDLAIRLDKANDLGYVRPIGFRAVFGSHGLERWEHSSGESNEAISERATPRERIRNVLLANGRMTKKALAEATGEKESTVYWHLQKMNDVTETKGGYNNREVYYGITSRREEDAI